MKQQTTGTFIAECRRGQGWTQSDLADRLGVTDKAVSRWETGKGYPEVTILPQLAEVLGVTVSELLAGERIPDEEQWRRAEEALLEAMQKSRDRMITGAGAVLLTSLISLILGLNLWKSFGYASDAYRGFFGVMEEGGFGMISQILVILLPVVTFVAAGYMIHTADRPKR